jgi:[ribosomal protein S18]-alanine N-acetyltransferase
MKEIKNILQYDIDAVLELEQDVQPTPWTKQNFIDSLRNHICWKLINYDDQNGTDTFIGYIIFTIIGAECEILNLGISKEARCRGYASYLLQQALEYAKALKVETAFLEVGSNNVAAINLYLKLRFQKCGSRKKYYATQSGAEDAIVLKLVL